MNEVCGAMEFGKNISRSFPVSSWPVVIRPGSNAETVIETAKQNKISQR
jgi:hypothetical protein